MLHRTQWQLALVLAAGNAAIAQPGMFSYVNFNIHHQFTLGAPGPWTAVEGRWFDHGWARSVNQWLDERAVWTPGQWPGDPPAQPVDFAEYGRDSLLGATWVVNNCHPAPFSPPFPACASPAFNVPVRFGLVNIPTGGTLPVSTFGMGGWVYKQADAHNGIVRGTGLSYMFVQPYGGTNSIDGEIRSAGGWSYNRFNMPEERGYGFAYTEILGKGLFNPAYQPPVWWGKILCAALTLQVPPAPPPSPFNPPTPWLAKRVYDPVTYMAMDTVTGLSISGTVFSVEVDAADGTDVDMTGGIMTINGLAASVRITMTDPRVSPQGTYELDVRNGAVVRSSATGFFAGMAPPPVGSVTPVVFPYPHHYPFSLDLTGWTGNPIEMVMREYSGGIEPVAELTCAKVTTEPVSVAVCAGMDATFAVGALGTGALSHQWEWFDGVSWWPVFNGATPAGGTVSGAQSAVLTIVGAGLANGGVYRCRVTDVCGAVTSQGAGLTITSCAPPCYANCDGSTQMPKLNVQDFACFLNKYAASDPYANCDGSTIPPVLNVGDFACFMNRYAAGCS